MFSERGDHGRGVLARNLEKHHKAGMALDKRRDVRVVCSAEKVSFPVAWHSAIVSLGWPFADGNRIDDLSQSALRGAALGLAPGDRASGAATAPRRACRPNWRLNLTPKADIARLQVNVCF